MAWDDVDQWRGKITGQDFGKGGPINIFTTGGGYGRGRAPPVTARGSDSSPRSDSSPGAVGAKPQPLFCFCVYHNYYHFTLLPDTSML